MTDDAKMTALFLGVFPTTVWLVDGEYVCCGDGLGLSCPVVLVAFQELVDAGLVEQVEKWPYPGFARRTDKDREIMDIWKKRGLRAEYIEPGVIAAFEPPASGPKG